MPVRLVFLQIGLLLLRNNLRKSIEYKHNHSPQPCIFVKFITIHIHFLILRHGQHHLSRLLCWYCCPRKPAFLYICALPLPTYGSGAHQQAFHPSLIRHLLRFPLPGTGSPLASAPLPFRGLTHHVYGTHQFMYLQRAWKNCNVSRPAFSFRFTSPGKRLKP